MVSCGHNIELFPDTEELVSGVFYIFPFILVDSISPGVSPSKCI